MPPLPQRLGEFRLVFSLLGGCSVGTGAWAATPALPVPCSAGACGNTTSQFVTAGSATAVAAQNALTVHQTSNTAVLNWSSFNIGANASVNFNQPSASAIALNKIYQGSPSQIFGNLTANGQVYLVNLNGFIFGSTATVNVGSLLASSLPLSLSDAKFSDGILSPLHSQDKNRQAAFDATLDPLAPGVGRTSVLDVNGSTVYDANGKPLAVQVLVQPGARLTAADQGRILLTGQNVTNGGTLTAPDGQVILAAGTKIYLQADTDAGLRGLVVEVEGTPTTNADGSVSVNTATNALGATMSAPRGDVWMVGLAVNQNGRISATTSVSANGSIHLEAAGGATVGGSGGDTPTVSSTQGGALTIGPQSEMDILTDTSGGTAVSSQTQLSSTITLLGEQVILQGGSITAPNATLTAVAAADPATASSSLPATLDANARLRIDSGTSIDLSGSNASLPVTANLVSAQLRSSELADDPTQRNGALHGLTVYIDARNGSPAIANLSGEIAGITQTIAQRTETGGKAVLESQGDVVFASGASLNVSGGSSTYAGGTLQTSYLVGANGQLYPIATADPSLTYVGVVNPTFTQSYNTWGVQDVVSTPGLSYYQTGYVQGAAAGSVQIAAPRLVLQGTLQGSAVNGLYQRTPSTEVSGGTLTIGIPKGVQTGVAFDYVTPAVEITDTQTPVVVADNVQLPGALTLDLPAKYLTDSGFTSTNIYSNYNFTLPANTPLVLPDGSTLTVNAGRIDVLSSITDLGGSLSFQNVLNLGSALTNTPTRQGVFIGDGVTLDVAGQWTNDRLAANGGGATPTATWQNGGSVALGVSSPGALLSIGNDVSIQASGGAWLETNGTTVAGTGGSIAFIDNALAGGLDVGSNLSIDAFGVNGAAGGSFSLTAPRVEISTAPAGAASSVWTPAQSADDQAKTPGEVFQIYSDLFSDYGFQNIKLSAIGLVAAGAPTTNVFTVDPGTRINASVDSLVLAQNAALLPSASTLAGVASQAPMLSYLQPAETVSFNAIPSADGKNTTNSGTAVGDILIGDGASITTTAGGSISLAGMDSLIVDGTLRAPAGSIGLHIISTGSGAGAYGAYDVGYLPNQRIELGTDSNLDVSGIFVAQPATSGLSLGSLKAGGSVSLLADRGSVVADAGSSISIAGASAALDVLQPNGTYGHEIATSAGGSLTVHSGEAISLLGDIQAAAGSGGTSGTAAAGSLDLELTRAEDWWSVTGSAQNATFNQQPLVIELEPTVPSTVPASLASNNQALLGAQQLSAAGFDSVRLESGGSILFSGNFTLNLARQLVLDAPVLAANTAANAALSAPYLEINNQVQTQQTPTNTNAATLGSGTLTFSGNEIDLLGSVVFQGTSNLTLASSGDLLLRGQAYSSTATSLSGSLNVAGNLELDAARIYPTTLTNFSITAVEDPHTGTPGTVSIGQLGADPGAPLSAGGALSISAYSISSTGSLYAPFGSIALDATGSIDLRSGSLTSVSGAGLTIPYGSTQYGGLQWTYAVDASESGSGNAPQITSIPNRVVTLTSPNITLDTGAKVDLTGGGNLVASEWVPGSGGSKDALAPYVAANPATGTASTGTAGLYAILPSTRGQAAPKDAQTADPNIAAGESIYISGGAGLAAGYYPLLPASYALEPGAVLVQIEPTYQSTGTGVIGSLSNGTPVVAGFLSYGSTGLHQTPGYTGFAVYPGSYGSTLATYTQTQASTFFASAASAGMSHLPADAGQLSISVTKTLNALGQVLTAAAAGGDAATIQISAPDLVIGTATDTPADAITISGSVLSGWDAGSLLLGGTAGAETLLTNASAATNGAPSPTSSSSIDVAANTVTIGAGTTLTAGQIIVVANQSIDVQAGATLESTSAASSTAPKSLPQQQSVSLTGSGPNPSFLAVSDTNWLIPVRAGGATAAGGGRVTVEAGATLASRGSLTIDALGGAALNGTLSGAGAEWSFGSSSIALGTTGSSTDAMALSSALIATLGGASDVRLASTGAIDLYSPVVLGTNGGSPTLNSLTLEAASLNNLTGAAGTAGATASQLGAKTLLLEGVGSSTSVPVAGSAGSSLSLIADTLDIGPNSLAVNGFATTRATVVGAIIGEGRGDLAIGGDVALSAGELTAAASARTTIGATGSLSVAPASSTSTTLPQFLAGNLTLSGSTVDVSGTINTPAGSVTIDSPGNVTIEGTASIAAAGTRVNIGNQTAASPGGTITIDAGGNLTLTSGSTLDVSGAGADAAGSISLTAGGQAALAGHLDGQATGAAGGSFSLDAGTWVTPGGGGNPLSLLSTALGSAAANTGGFTTAIDLRVRSGDLSLDSNSALTSNTVTLTADTGKLTVGGDISAPSGALRGTLSLFGGNGVELTAGGSLHADGAGSGGLGGSIEIGSGQLIAGSTGTLDAYNTAAISLDAGSTISAAGAAGMGTLLLRAPALTASNDVAISALASDVSKVGEVIIEPVLPFNTKDTTSATGAAEFSSVTAPTQADFQNIGQIVQSYMTAATPTIEARLATTATPFVINAGVEIVAPNVSTDPNAPSVLTLPASGLDLSANGLNWQFNGQPVDLTIRAAGGIVVAGTVSDGFNVQSVGDNNGTTQPTLIDASSASIRLVAGADLSSANPLAVVANPTALPLDLSIAPGVVVRTGTGNLDLIAAGNIVLEGAGSGAYTAGTPAIAPGGSASTPYPGVDSNNGNTSPASDSNGENYGVFIPGTDLLMSFPTGGGDLTVRAGGNIDNEATTTASAVTAWQLREGGNSASTPPTWGVNLAAYDWNFGTLGGGDLSIAAGGSVTNVSAASAGSLLPQAAGATPTYVNSGGLSLTAGGDIGSAQVFLANGTGTVAAGGALTATLKGKAGTANAGSAFYLQSSSIDVTARDGAIIDGVYNPTALVQPVDGGGSPPLAGTYYTYGADSGISVQSVAGDVVLGTSITAPETLLGAYLANQSNSGSSIFPSNLTVEALTGNINFGAGIGKAGVMTLYPSATGQLDLLAAQNINGFGNKGGSIIMSDVAPSTLATVDNPQGGKLSSTTLFSNDVHANDTNPALVTAGGSITELSLVLPKAAELVAGQDIIDLTYFGQNLSSTDQTLFSAGRDFSYLNNYTGSAVSVGGPGQLDILAGRDISLGFSQGVVTTGNLLNANLPTSQGADVTMVTGLGTTEDTSTFLTKIVMPSTTYQGELVAYVEQVNGSTGLSYAEAAADFKTFTTAEQQPFLDRVFFNELSLSGIAANTVKGAGFSQGYAAIDALFPGSRSGAAGAVANAYAGDLTLQFSRIYTLSGGNINLVVPGGGIDVGLASPPAKLSQRSPSTLGIVTEGTGDINIYAKNDVNVNSSRVFTLGGGNILIWSDEGSIDAGLGAKTSISAPPPTVLISSSGTVTIDFSGAATGSGIRTIQTQPTTPAGNVDLVAPVGTVNAGDAGIGSSGNINIAAQSVVGVTNINFGGTATGVPATVSNVSASLSGAASAASGASNTATNAVTADTADKESAAPLAQAALSWLDVFVTGLGEENCKPDDIDCLARQKKAAH